MGRFKTTETSLKVIHSQTLNKNFALSYQF